jgi:hypothetical protein
VPQQVGPAKRSTCQSGHRGGIRSGRPIREVLTTFRRSTERSAHPSSGRPQSRRSLRVRAETHGSRAGGRPHGWRADSAQGKRLWPGHTPEFWALAPMTSARFCRWRNPFTQGEHCPSGDRRRRRTPSPGSPDGGPSACWWRAGVRIFVGLATGYSPSRPEDPRFTRRRSAARSLFVRLVVRALPRSAARSALIATDRRQPAAPDSYDECWPGRWSSLCLTRVGGLDPRPDHGPSARHHPRADPLPRTRRMQPGNVEDLHRGAPPSNRPTIAAHYAIPQPLY